jgi:ribosomal protein S18 acetylase RimI-like enzyme
VLPAFQGRGIGPQVLACVLREAAGRPVALRCLRSNPRALAFWQREGFVVVGETETHHEMARPPA